jgi:xylulose-5-phosphate/fructose-6-phosphate phosphoketolase
MEHPRERLEQLQANFRSANYLSVAQLYLRENVLLRQPLEARHIKPRLLGHWGTVPGINLLYAHLSRLIRDTGMGTLLVVGTGHGARGGPSGRYLGAQMSEVKPYCWPEYGCIARVER